MEPEKIIAATEAILFASGDPVPVGRIAAVLGVSEEQVLDAAETLSDACIAGGRGVRVLRLDDKLQMCSASEFAGEVQRALEQRRPPKLSQAALEVLAIVAYYQPVTRAYIDQLRGVDSSYTVGVLSERGLILPVGKLEAPGRPTLYGTGETFLRTMGVSSLSELPVLPDVTTSEGIIELQNKIDALRAGGAGEQMQLFELGNAPPTA